MCRISFAEPAPSGSLLLRLIMVISIAVLLTACASSSQVQGNIDVSKWRGLGEELWTIDADSVSAGPTEQIGFLVSNQTYTNFRLSVEFWIEDETNSGVFIRCARPDVVADVNPDTCYEVNIWDNHPVQEFRTGSIVKRVVPAVHVDTIGRWNRLVIEAQDDAVSVFVNGLRTADLVDSQLSSGLIALQYAGKNRLKFRDLVIK